MGVDDIGRGLAAQPKPRKRRHQRRAGLAGGTGERQRRQPDYAHIGPEIPLLARSTDAFIVATAVSWNIDIHLVPALAERTTHSGDGILNSPQFRKKIIRKHRNSHGPVSRVPARLPRRRISVMAIAPRPRRTAVPRITCSAKRG